ncbi:cytochrome P450, partial [Streptomyces sp. NPDC059900]
YHREQRRLLQPAFHRGRLPAQAGAMTREITAVMEQWRDGNTIDVLAQMHTITSRVVSKTIFNSDAVSEAAQIVREAVDVIIGSIFHRMVMPIQAINRLPTPANLRYRAAITRIHDAVTHAADEYRRDGCDHADMLSALLAARDHNGNPLSDQEVREQVITLLVAGIDTTGVALSWALNVLAHDDELRSRLHREVDATLRGRVATWDDLPHLDLTARVITETLRVYSPIWIITRTVTQDVDLAGYFLAAGSTVAYSPYLIHHRADLYPDPERFNPDRWLSDLPQRRPRTQLLPFGGGPRKCIGDTLATTEATLALASIAARWTLTPPPGAPAVDVKANVFLTPRNLYLRTETRAPTKPGAGPPVGTPTPPSSIP